MITQEARIRHLLEKLAKLYEEIGEITTELMRLTK